MSGKVLESQHISKRRSTSLGWFKKICQLWTFIKRLYGKYVVYVCVVVTLLVYNRKYVKRFGNNNNNSHNIELDFYPLDNFEQLIACHI